MSKSQLELSSLSENKLTLSAQYELLVKTGSVKPDVNQENAVKLLNEISLSLEKKSSFCGPRAVIQRFSLNRKTYKIKGLYLFGGVGTGKSMLMDLFYDCANISGKRRVHFHAFMQEIHKKIGFERNKGLGDPIKSISSKIAKKIQLLCFDELQILDITDAMIVGRLFEKLFDLGVTIVTTSNITPDDLYKDGLNRNLFLPFIELLKQNVELCKVDSNTDYRQGLIRGKESYLNTTFRDSAKKYENLWLELVPEEHEEILTLKVGSRSFDIPRFFHGVGRIRFDDLCNKALGALDYLTLCKHVKVLFIDEIPILDSTKLDVARRFIVLIDNLYEARIKLICTAQAEPDFIYTAKKGAFEFRRTVSRLCEMRSDRWPN